MWNGDEVVAPLPPLPRREATILFPIDYTDRFAKDVDEKHGSADF
jgi:hypothetical protein